MKKELNKEAIEIAVFFDFFQAWTIVNFGQFEF